MGDELRGRPMGPALAGEATFLGPLGEILPSRGHMRVFPRGLISPWASHRNPLNQRIFTFRMGMETSVDPVFKGLLRCLKKAL